MEHVSFGHDANKDREDGDNQAEPDEYLQERTQIVLGDSDASHREKQRQTLLSHYAICERNY